MKSRLPLMISYFVICAGFILSAACATTPDHPTLQLTSESDYFSAIDTNTEKSQIYKGFYNILDVRLTFLKTNVKMKQVDQLARAYQWDPSTYEGEKSKAITDLQRESEFFLSFFVPERKNDDLAKKQTLWRVFMDVSGKRFEGKAVKMKNVLGEIQSLYPDHTRWSTPYKVTFPVPSSQVEMSPIKITVTGPIGTSVMNFKNE